jgi:hypothetical protein
MTIATNLLTSGTALAAGTFTTASITPTANRLVLLAIANSTFGPVEYPQSVSGNGLTWTQFAQNSFHSSNSTISLWRAMGPAPSAGTISIVFANAQNDCLWSVMEFSGVDTSGTGGSGAVVQSVTSKSSSTTLSTTLAAFGDVLNATYGVGGCMNTPMGTGTSMTTVHNLNGTNTGVSMLTEYALSNVSPVTETTSVSDAWAIIGVEIKNSSVAVPDGSKMMNLFENPLADEAEFVGDYIGWGQNAAGTNVFSGVFGITGNIAIGRVGNMGLPAGASVVAWQETVDNSAFTGTGTFVIGVPPSTVNGDLLIACINTAGLETVTDPAGWTRILRTVSGGTQQDNQQITYWRIANNEPANYTWLQSVNQISGFIWRITGADPVNPINASSGNFGTGETVTALSISPTLAGTLLLYIAGDNSNLAQITAWNTPTGFFERSYITGGGDQQTKAATLLSLAAGPTRNVTSTATGGSVDHWTAQLIAIKPFIATSPLTGVKATGGVGSFGTGLNRKISIASPGKTSIQRSISKTLKANTIPEVAFLKKSAPKKLAVASVSVVKWNRAKPIKINYASVSTALIAQKALAKRIFVSSISFIKKGSAIAKKPLAVSSSVATKHGSFGRMIKGINTSSAMLLRTIKAVRKPISVSLASIGNSRNKYRPLVATETSFAKKAMAFQVKRSAISVSFRLMQRGFKKVASSATSGTVRSIRVIAFARRTVISASAANIAKAIVLKRIAYLASIRLISKAAFVKRIAVSSSAYKITKAAVTKKSAAQTSASKLSRGLYTLKSASSVNAAFNKKQIRSKRTVASISYSIIQRMINLARLKPASINTSNMKRAALLRKPVVSVSLNRVIKAALIMRKAASVNNALIRRMTGAIRSAASISKAKLSTSSDVILTVISASVARKFNKIAHNIKFASTSFSILLWSNGRTIRATSISILPFFKKAISKIMRQVTISQIVAGLIVTLRYSTVPKQFIVVPQRIRSFTLT